MGLSKQHLDLNSEPIVIDLDRLSRALLDACPDLVFCVVMGTAKDGVVPSHSDLDLACYVAGDRCSLQTRQAIEGVVFETCGSVRCDLGVLNHAEPVYRYEALKGRLLFTRDEETWLRFYSLTSREYETQLADYERQLSYRLDGAA